MKHADWLTKIDRATRKEYADEFARLEKHVAKMTETPSKRFQDSILGKQAAGWFEREMHDRLAYAILEGIDGCRKAKDKQTESLLLDALAWLLRRKLHFSEHHVGLLLQAVESAPSVEKKLALLPGVLAALQRVAGTQSLPPEVSASLRKIRNTLLELDAKKYTTAVKLTALIKSLADDSVVERLHPDEGWADWLRSWFANLQPSSQEGWNAFLRDAGSVYPESSWSVSFEETGVDLLGNFEAAIQASQRLQLNRLAAAAWRQMMAAHVTRLGRDEVGSFLEHCLHKVPGSKPGMLAREVLNRELLRGLLWLSLDLASAELIQAVQRATRYFYEKKSGLADAGVIVLFQMATSASAGALAAISHFVKAESHRSFVGQALAMLSEKGIQGDELAGQALPTFGFTEVGKLTRHFDDVRADLEIGPGRTVELTWTRGNKTLKSIPASVRRQHGGEIEAIKVTSKGVKETLTGLVSRLEASWLTRAKYQVENWRGQLIDHFVGGTIGRRLIWQFDFENQITDRIVAEGRICRFPGTASATSGRSVRGPVASAAKLGPGGDCLAHAAGD